MRLIGTAGHIDHGKSTLVQALTGVHPSRLPEERARGMTIDLGYAHLDHPDGHRLGVVDVPGHEKLVKNMVAGATGFELALWVVDARESVMPQSREHLHILELLGVRALMPVITKAAVATAEQIERTERDVASLVSDVALPVLASHVVDSVSGAGIAELKRAIFAATRDQPADDDAPPYLAIDRAFSVKGVGTVVTGTLVRGTLAEGDEVVVTSAPGTWRVRALTNHHARVARIGAGHRVGVNLAGLHADDVRRGDVLVSPAHPYRARRVNARLRWTPDAPRAWKHGAPLLFHAGCLEVECRLWGTEEADGASWAQLELSREACFFPGQRFILRGGTPLATVGGGEILDLAPDRPRRVTMAERAAYVARARGDECLSVYHAAAGATVLDLAALARRWMVAEDTLRRDVARSASLRLLTPDGPLAWSTSAATAARERLRRWLDAEPRDEHAVPYERVARELRLPPAHVQAVMRALLAADAESASRLRLDGAAAVVHPGRVELAPEDQRLADALLARLRREWLKPSTVDAYRELLPAPRGALDRVVARLCEAGRLVRVSRDLVLHADAARALRNAPAHYGLDAVRAAEFGQALGLTRKHGIPYLEFLNREGIMRRAGDVHHRVR
ncbi:selenocysteine-specific translation elongation factor (plasmid) [Gemmatirosa kalamazoonensis]|uniref:Selenocysteine-specific elongation factor n=1 Tax=Gemmatirosa kalamazoonensis TaxID=861299 RepID=W0RRZ0_9BACT|nr:selenocysteine-specific translation elongation factor [Gemmatirosa kalamazoonensis]AHG93476.1 selenocysteine-specific translation elongation factor [Gemmatirosa kalamazoonensis]